jgi:hypothetical protein
MKRGADLEDRDRLDRPVVKQIDRHGWVVDEVLSDTGNVRGDRDAELAEAADGPIPERIKSAGLAYVPAESTTS